MPLQFLDDVGRRQVPDADALVLAAGRQLATVGREGESVDTAPVATEHTNLQKNIRVEDKKPPIRRD